MPENEPINRESTKTASSSKKPDPKADKPTNSRDKAVADGDLLRVTLTYNKDGSLYEGTRQPTLDELKKVMAHPGNRAKVLGPEGPAAAVQVDPSIIAILYVGLVRCEQLLAQVLGAPEDRVRQLTVTGDQLQALIPASQAMLDKYGVSLGKWETETAFAMALLPVVLAHTAILRGHPAGALSESAAFPAGHQKTA